MVDSVKNLVSRIDPQNKSVVQKASVETEAKTSASGRVTSPGQEASVKVSDISKLSKEPPVDFEAVERIKTAISKGQYPIDLDRVSDAKSVFQRSHLSMSGRNKAVLLGP